VVTDVTNLESVNNALKWKELVEENCDFFNGKAIPIIMVQNKIDLLSQFSEKCDKNPEKCDKNDEINEEFEIRKKDIAKKFAKDNDFITNIQVSAKENRNLEKIFEKLIREIRDRKLIYYDNASNFGENDDKCSRSRSSLRELQKDLEKNTKKSCDC